MRGGGEHGRAWHQGANRVFVLITLVHILILKHDSFNVARAAGTKLQKHNVFDDFSSVLDDVCNRGLTVPSKIVIEGGSNGGLLVCAMITQVFFFFKKKHC